MSCSDLVDVLHSLRRQSSFFQQRFYRILKQLNKIYNTIFLCSTAINLKYTSFHTLPISLVNLCQLYLELICHRMVLQLSTFCSSAGRRITINSFRKCLMAFVKLPQHFSNTVTSTLNFLVDSKYFIFECSTGMGLFNKALG